MDAKMIQLGREDLGYPKNVPVPKVRDWNKVPADYKDRAVYFVHLDSIRAVGKAATDPDYTNPNFKRSYERVKHFERGGKRRLLNPRGATGITGVGALWHPGASFTADAAITRRNDEKLQRNGKGLLEVLLIRRGDNRRLALPGGFMDPGENPMHLADRRKTAQRELLEETGLQVDLNKSREIFKGATDSFRNTDWAWIETSVHNRHLPWEIGRLLVPKAADDASEAFWAPLKDIDLKQMNDSHAEYISLLRQQSFA